MAKPLCMNNTNSDANQYSSPVPLIGLYIAGATSVCLLLMLLDTISGLRRKNLYIPCRFFSLNSATLTLVGVASKLSVDLTTYMPSARDQLSKLTGTAIVCICIGFFMPSLGINRESESIANMIALSLLVITIFVNICIQMSTGVIFSFMVEHMVILGCMLALLFLLWCSTLENRSSKILIAQGVRFQLSDVTRGNFMRRLKNSYIMSRTLNPQLIFCNDYSGVVVDIICILCLVVISQAAFRSLILDKLQFCEGISDYGWSVWTIIISQIVTIIIGGLTICFRWLALILLDAKVNNDNNIRYILWTQLYSLRGRFDRDELRAGILGTEFSYFILQFSWMKTRSIKKFIVTISRLSLKFGLLVIFILISLIIAFIPLCLSIISTRLIMQCCPSNSETGQDDDIISFLKKEERKSHIYLYRVSEWIARQSEKDVNKWINGKKSASSNNYMVQMLSTIDASSADTLWIDYQEIGRSYGQKKVSCLSMVVFVKILSITIPLYLTETLRRALDEVFEIIYFIEERVNVEGGDDRRRSELAKLLWTSGDIDLSKIDLKERYGSVEYVISVVNSLQTKSKEGILSYEWLMVSQFIRARKCTTVEQLCKCIEQLFAGMLYSFLAQLPNTIFKEVNMWPIEEYEERAKFMIKLLCGLDSSMENKVRWVFPEDAKVTGFFDFQDHNANIQNSTTGGGSIGDDVEMGAS